MKKIYPSTLALASLLLLAPNTACVGMKTGTNYTSTQTDQITNGMTKQQVVEIMQSQPTGIAQGENGTEILTWRYVHAPLISFKNTDKTLTVTFRNGRVVAKSEGNTANVTSNPFPPR